jgi:hypothetical protein
LTFVRPPGPTTSLNVLVPAAVPSERHKCEVCEKPGLALKNSVPLTFAKKAGNRPPLAGSMSVTMVVPAAVPFERHNWRPSTLSALKNSVPLTFVVLRTVCPLKPGLPTVVVPEEVPSERHSS